MADQRSAGHVPVLLEEVVQALAVKPDGTYVDATYGRGGHARAVLGALGPHGRMVVLDRDEEALADARALGDARLTVVHSNFGRLGEVLAQSGVAEVDGVLLDIGVSSPQIDVAERGFSFRQDGPLDMRMDRSSGQTAAEWLAVAEPGEIVQVLQEFGEERHARAIARAIVAARATRPIETTRELAALVARIVRTREPGQDPATRTFQAIRIRINDELGELRAALQAAVAALALGGRLAVISFHSLEDRIVKNFMRDASTPTPVPRGFAVRESEREQPALRLVGRAVRAGEAEVARNPRSRSATLRVVERVR